MEIIGVITPTASSAFTKDQWISAADLVSDLHRHERVEVRNPATGETVWAQPPASSRKLVIDGDQIGNFSWSQNEEPFIWVESKTDKIHETTNFAKELALKFGCKFTTEMPQ